VRKIPVRVEVNQPPLVEAGEDHIIIKGSEVQIDASSINQVRYIWSPDYNLSCTQCQTPLASPERDTTYMVTAINEFGCKAKDELRIRVISDCSGNMVYVPNTFSPNGDGSNDKFFPRGKGIDRMQVLRIFNRWGEVVYEKINFPVNDASYGWDGTFKGRPPQPDVYIFQAEVYCSNGELIKFAGNVSLIQ
jgi:gliding motility-associated-like protein